MYTPRYYVGKLTTAAATASPRFACYVEGYCITFGEASMEGQETCTNDDEWDSASDSYSDMDEDAIDLSGDNLGNTIMRRPTLKTLPRTDNPENIILKRRRHCQMAERYVCNIQNA